VVVGNAGAVLVYVVAVIVWAGRVAGDTGVLEASVDAEELTCRRTHTLAAAGRSSDIVLIGSAVAVVI
jgi:uncharacterized membrane protein